MGDREQARPPCPETLYRTKNGPVRLMNRTTSPRTAGYGLTIALMKSNPFGGCAPMRVEIAYGDRVTGEIFYRREVENVARIIPGSDARDIRFERFDGSAIERSISGIQKIAYYGAPDEEISMGRVGVPRDRVPEEIREGIHADQVQLVSDGGWDGRPSQNPAFSLLNEQDERRARGLLDFETTHLSDWGRSQ